MQDKTSQNKTFFIIILVLFGLDVLTKQIIKAFQINTTTRFIDITYVTNTGTMWSLFSGTKYINTIFIILSFVALGFLFWYKHQEPEHQIPIAILIAGVLGNLLDRIIQGSVIDWINVHFFPIFNIADSAIVIGTILLILKTILSKESNEDKKIMKLKTK